LQQEERQAAYAYAVRLLAGREYCTAQIRQKLKGRGYECAIIDAVIAILLEDDYLSESRFAEQFVAARLRRGESPWLAAQKAREKGVDESALQQALAAVEGEYDALAACRELLAARDPRGVRHADEKQWQRQARFLRNKGYDTATILRVMKERSESEE
jgi:regulatory protein